MSRVQQPIISVVMPCYNGARYLMVAAGSALGQSDDSGAPRSVRVSYADLDLGSRAGAAEAFARIRSAAGQVCDSGADIRMLERQAQYAHCRSEAVARAVDTLHAPLVASMAGRTNTSFVAGR